MKTFKYLCVICLLLTSCFGRVNHSTTLFVDKSISDFSTSSCFLYLLAKTQNDTIPIVIQNRDLRNMYFQNNIIPDSIKYVSFVKETLAGDNCFDLRFIDDSVINSYKVVHDSIFYYYKELPTETLLTNYFQDSCLNNKEVSFRETLQIISILYERKILCKRNCLSGEICIY